MQADLSIGAPGEPEVETVPGEPDAAVDDFAELDLEVAQPVSETQVRDMLDGLGRSASLAINFGVADLWRFTPAELDGLVPPLTRIVNNRPALARAVHKGDTVFVALQLSAYAGRRVDLVSAERRRRRQEDEDGDRQREAARHAEAGDAADRGAAGGWGSGYANGSGSAAPLS